MGSKIVAGWCQELTYAGETQRGHPATCNKGGRQRSSQQGHDVLKFGA